MCVHATERQQNVLEFFSAPAHKKQTLNRRNPNAVPLPDYLDLAASWGQQNGQIGTGMVVAMPPATAKKIDAAYNAGSCGKSGNPNLISKWHPAPYLSPYHRDLAVEQLRILHRQSLGGIAGFACAPPVPYRPGPPCEPTYMGKLTPMSCYSSTSGRSGLRTAAGQLCTPGQLSSDEYCTPGESFDGAETSALLVYSGGKHFATEYPVEAAQRGHEWWKRKRGRAAASCGDDVLSSTKIDRAALVFVLLQLGYAENINAFHAKLQELKMQNIPAYSTMCKWINDDGKTSFRRLWPSILRDTPYGKLKHNLPAVVTRYCDGKIELAERIHPTVLDAYHLQDAPSVVTPFSIDADGKALSSSRRHSLGKEPGHEPVTKKTKRRQGAGRPPKWKGLEDWMVKEIERRLGIGRGLRRFDLQVFHTVGLCTAPQRYSPAVTDMLCTSTNLLTP